MLCIRPMSYFVSSHPAHDWQTTPELEEQSGRLIFRKRITQWCWQYHSTGWILHCRYSEIQSWIVDVVAAFSLICSHLAHWGNANCAIPDTNEERRMDWPLLNVCGQWALSCAVYDSLSVTSVFALMNLPWLQLGGKPFAWKMSLGFEFQCLFNYFKADLEV